MVATSFHSMLQWEEYEVEKRSSTAVVPDSIERLRSKLCSKYCYLLKH